MFRTVLFALVVTAALSVHARAPRCDRLLVGGVVHTQGGAQRLEVAVEQGRIVALIPPEQATAWRASAGEVTALYGAHVYTGLTEGHGHFIGYGQTLEKVDLEGTATFEEVIDRVRRAAARTPGDGWLLGRGWDQNDWPEKVFPTHQRLSAAVPDRPVLLTRVDGHAVLINARALEAAGIAAGTPDPPGGKILRDAQGEPTGVLVDTAAGLVERLVPRPNAADIERWAIAAGRKLAGFGFTEIHDAGTTREELAVLRRMQAAGTLPVRVYAILDGTDDGLLDGEFAAGPTLTRDGMLGVRAVKLYVDGALGSRGALLSSPYADEPGTRGLQVTTTERLAAVVRRAGKAGFQPCVHAIGDAAVTRILDVFERELGPASRLRPRIEHSQIVRPEDVARFAALGAIASVQPTHCTSDMPWAPARLGEQRTPWAYRWRSLLAAGARLSLGSDVPVESPDPRLGVWAAVTRRPPGVTAHPGWNLAEALTPAEALAGYTTWAAHSAFEDDWRGRIAPGFAADLTVVDRPLEQGDPATILQIRVLRTIVAGRDAFVAGSGS
ncbi:MAG: amidohydrolase [Acidobacteriota bacterium]